LAKKTLKLMRTAKQIIIAINSPVNVLLTDAFKIKWTILSGVGKEKCDALDRT